MAIKLITNYSKRLGLPGYSSHQFSISVETELAITDDIALESERLYQRLQASVDEQILQTGFVPPAGYGMELPPASPRRSPDSSTEEEILTDEGPWECGTAWNCSHRQRNLILKLASEQQLEPIGINALAVELFGKDVSVLAKVEASQLINELLIRSHDSARRVA